jgi:hypothetical protein
MQERLRVGRSASQQTVEHYDFDVMNVVLLVPFGAQTGASLGFDSTGTVTRDTFDAGGALISRTTEPFHKVFAVRRALGDRWLNVAVLPEPPTSSGS